MTFQALSIEQFRKRVGERRVLGVADRDRDNVLNAEERESLDLALQRATSFAYSLIGIKYETPLDENEMSEALLGHIADIAEWYMPGRGDVASKHLRQRYDDAVMWCKSVGKREAQLGGDSKAQPEPRREIAVHTGDPVTFTNDAVGAIL